MGTSARRIISAGLLVVALAACGGGGSDEDGVATLDSGAAADDGGTDDGGGGGQGGGPDISPEFQDAMVDFAECMRDQGIDFPDPGTSGDGMIVIGPRDGGGPPSQAEMEKFEAADEACRHILEAVEDEMPRPDPEQEAEMRDQALAFAECMRDHGIDFPDPQFEEGGGMTMGFGSESGVDPSDPEFQDAQEECAGDDGGIFSVGGGASVEIDSAEEE